VVVSENFTVESGRAAIFVCVAFYDPDTIISVSWYRDGHMLTCNDSNHYITTENSTQGGRQFRYVLLQICSASVSDSALYTCIVTNSTSEATSDIELIVLPCEKP